MSVLPRKCGHRKPGKIYFVVEKATIGMTGLPVEHFLVDPPRPIEDVAAQGITIRPRVVAYDYYTNEPVYATDSEGRTIHDIYDWVGGEYPDVVTFVEEAREQGVSRLNPRPSDFSLITKDSRYWLIHPRAIIVDPRPHFNERVDTGHPRCPKKFGEHLEPEQEWLAYQAETCAGLWWEDVTDYSSKGQGRLVTARRATGTTFQAALPPEEADAERRPGIFMGFPIGKMGRWDVIKSEDDTHKEALERLKNLRDGLFKRTRLMDM